MSKITDSLRMTVIAGIVLTVVMVLVAPMIAGEPESLGDKAREQINELTKGE